MSDMIDLYKAMKAHNQAQRQAAASDAPIQIAELNRLGYAVQTLSANGPHLRIAGVVDFWPSTGRWRELRGKAKGTGFTGLCGLLASRYAGSKTPALATG